MARKTTRTPLSKERVLRAAASLADKRGLEALSMRNLAARLKVEAMSLYNHVSNKDEILDGLVDIVIAEIELPQAEDGWKSGMRRRAHSARDMFKRHPWAISLMESRSNPGPASMTYYDAVIGCLRGGGFTIAMAAHAFSLLDSYILGFVMQELKLPFQTPEELAEIAEHITSSFPMQLYPHFGEMITEHTLKPGYSYAAEFEFGLELILDGLERGSQK